MVDIIFDQHLGVTDLTQKLPSSGKVEQAELNLSQFSKTKPDSQVRAGKPRACNKTSGKKDVLRKNRTAKASRNSPFFHLA
jgi:hypothetical protein